jgi:hypothetical protein
VYKRISDENRENIFKVNSERGENKKRVPYFSTLTTATENVSGKKRIGDASKQNTRFETQHHFRISGGMAHLCFFFSHWVRISGISSSQK